ncbi:aldehyde dehydrogenase family protein [Spongisporangium articulatum]|uniref:Aldehyde dehydrogenase family protein n=1 Tax=Spongisporangium articulatum TaxID=3362603 RepID=A0ABW8AM35_9ACTN
MAALRSNPKLYVAGRFVDGTGAGATPVVSPVTGQTLAELPDVGRADVDAAVAAARVAFDDYRHWTASERAQLCHRVARLIEADAAELARLTTLEQGKPYAAEAVVDVEDTAALFTDSAEDAKRLFGEVIPSTSRTKRMFTFRVPVGVWAAVTPWNFPLMIMTEFVAPALATGNAVVAKPPGHTPLACLRLGELLTEAGVPEGLVSILPGDGPVGEQLVTHPGVDAIGFVGSSATAERIVRAAGLKRSIIEASGNGPVVVLDDADLEHAAEAAVYGAYWNAGQVCCATERVLVQAEVHEEFVAAVLKARSAAVLGDPFDDATTMGPLNNETSAAKMDRHVADAVAQGASVLAGGARRAGMPTDLYYEFTVLDDVTPAMAVAREESFGPVLPIVPVAGGDDELLRVANADPLGLQGAVFTSSLPRAFRFGEELRCGSVVVNDSTDYFEGAQPFGGAAGSRTGWGRVGGLAQLRDMTDTRCMIVGLDRGM